MELWSVFGIIEGLVRKVRCKSLTIDSCLQSVQDPQNLDINVKMS